MPPELFYLAFVVVAALVGGFFIARSERRRLRREKLKSVFDRYKDPK